MHDSSVRCCYLEKDKQKNIQKDVGDKKSKESKMKGKIGGNKMQNQVETI